MGKVKFVDNAGNFTAKGYVLNEVYETGPRTESGKNPGKFYYNVKGKNVAGNNEWETNLFLYFKFPSNSEEANQANAYLAILKGTPTAPVQVTNAPITQATAQIGTQPPTAVPQQEVYQQLPTVVPKTQDNPYDMYPAQTQNVTSLVIEKEVTKDILLAGLTNLDFNSLNISILKTGGKITLGIIMDSLPVLKINSGNISATSVLEQIVSTFSESAQIVSTIREWRKGLSELQAELAKESVDTKAKVDAKAKRVAKVKEVPVIETAIPNEPVISEPTEELAPVFMDDSLDIPQVETGSEEGTEPEEETGNGLDPDVEDYVLK